MAEYTKLRLSGSSNGKGIKIGAVGTPGTLIHTSASGTLNQHEIWLYATNNHSSSLELTIEWGGVANPDDRMQMSIPSKTGLFLIVPGLVLNNSLVVRAFAQTADLISIFGWANLITA